MSNAWTTARSGLLASLARSSGSSLKFAEGALPRARALPAPRADLAQPARTFATSSTSHAANLHVEPPFISPLASIPDEAHSVRRRGMSPPSIPSTASEGIQGVETTDIALETVDSFDLDFIPPALSNQSLSLIYTATAPPPLTALSALANRLAAASTNPALSYSLASDLPLLEQCLIHDSFWTGVASLPSPPQGAVRSYTHFNDTPLTTSKSSLTYAHNGPLATLGNALLGALTSELLLSSFPHLPTRVTKAALTMYAGPKSLAAVASSWGVGPSRLERRLVGAEDGTKQSKGDRAYGHLVGGVGPGKSKTNELDGAAGMGLVRWNRTSTTPLRDSVLFEDALASVSRAVIGAIYQLHGFEAMRAFVHAQFLSRLIPAVSSSLASPAASADIAPLLKFTSPSRVLSLTCAAYEMPLSSHRLLKESGRLSSHPTFLSGVFSGERKLGEGFGSSIKMSEWRASEDALRRLYLGGRKVGGLPSDVWVAGKTFEGITVGDSEVAHESKERSMRPRRSSSQAGEVEVHEG